MAIYMMRETQPITTAWIYHNATLWLISLSSDGSNWLTIADKNLGATTVCNYGDATTAENQWNFYQWGNNHWFLWSIGTYSPTSTSTVNAWTYWPWNYYDSSTWIQQAAWDSSVNANLWGNTTNTNEARRWPCPEWWHIPSRADTGTTLKNIISWLWLSGSAVFSALKITNTAFYKTYSFGNASTWFVTWITDSYTWKWYYYTPYNSISNSDKWNWFPIRPFKNEAVQPREWEDRTKLN